MNYISVIIYCAIFSTISAIPLHLWTIKSPSFRELINNKSNGYPSIEIVEGIKPKLCIDCKHFKKNFFERDKYGKCHLFPIVDNNESFLVDGIKNAPNVRYHYCSVSRLYDEMCGKDGKHYEAI